MLEAVEQTFGTSKPLAFCSSACKNLSTLLLQAEELGTLQAAVRRWRPELSPLGHGLPAAAQRRDRGASKGSSRCLRNVAAVPYMWRQDLDSAGR